jgi:hypothetical protein
MTPFTIVFHFCWYGMLSTIQFDDYLFFETDKIDNVYSYGLLSPEFESREMFSS